MQSNGRNVNYSWQERILFNFKIVYVLALQNLSLDFVSPIESNCIENNNYMYVYIHHIPKCLRCTCVEGTPHYELKIVKLGLG